jgi:hypothetical protein
MPGRQTMCQMLEADVLLQGTPNHCGKRFYANFLSHDFSIPVQDWKSAHKEECGSSEQKGDWTIVSCFLLIYKYFLFQNSLF